MIPSPTSTSTTSSNGRSTFVSVPRSCSGGDAPSCCRMIPRVLSASRW